MLRRRDKARLLTAAVLRQLPPQPHQTESAVDLDLDELAFIRSAIDAIVRQDREYIRQIPKGPLFDEAVF